MKDAPVAAGPDGEGSQREKETGQSEPDSVVSHPRWGMAILFFCKQTMQDWDGEGEAYEGAVGTKEGGVGYAECKGQGAAPAGLIVEAGKGPQREREAE